MPAAQSYWRAVVTFMYHLQWRSEFSGSGSNDSFRVGWLWSTNNRNSSLDNSRLLTRNLSEGLSQPFFVIKINGCNDRDIGLECVGGVESAAEPRLKNDKINSRPS